MHDLDDDEYEALTDEEKDEYHRTCDEAWSEWIDEQMANCTCGAYHWVDKKGWVQVADCVCGAW